MRFIFIPILIFLAACTAAEPQPYTLTSHQLTNGNYQLALKGDAQVTLKQLEAFAQVQANEACGGPFLLRDHRVETYLPNENDRTTASTQAVSNMLRIEVECFQG